MTKAEEDFNKALCERLHRDNDKEHSDFWDRINNKVDKSDFEKGVLDVKKSNNKIWVGLIAIFITILSFWVVSERRATEKENVAIRLEEKFDYIMGFKKP